MTAVHSEVAVSVLVIGTISCGFCVRWGLRLRRAWREQTEQLLACQDLAFNNARERDELLDDLKAHRRNYEDCVIERDEAIAERNRYKDECARYSDLYNEVRTERGQTHELLARTQQAHYTATKELDQARFDMAAMKTKLDSARAECIALGVKLLQAEKPQPRIVAKTKRVARKKNV